MATRIGAGSAIAGSVTNLDFARRGRFKRYGRLPVPPGADGQEVRCACNVCGAHLYALPGARGRVEGQCVVCGSVRVTPVA